MKTCPSCGTQYTDETLRFCLQDGTPLTAVAGGDPEMSLPGGEEETVARARPIPNHAGASVEPAWRPGKEVDRVSPSPVLPKRPRSTLAVASLAAALVLLVLLLGGAVGLWLYFRDPDGEAARNTGNSTAGQNKGSAANSNVNRNAARQPTAANRSNANANANANLQQPSPEPPAVDKSEASREVSEMISAWEADSEQADLDSLIGRYADSVEYYQRSGASPRFIRADKQRGYQTYSSLSFDISNVDIAVGDKGDTATAVFDKEWVFEGSRRSTGKVQQQLRFRRISGEWRITGERDLKVYYSN